MTTTPAEQLQFALEVVTRLNGAGFTAYFAGGCVRDRLLGRIPKDYDVATDAKPCDVKRIFGKRRTLAHGEHFGVMVVLGPKMAGNVEVATFRRDDGYTDGRRPDAVSFTDAEEDARRRDFTINAMFFDPVHEKVLDYVGGVLDLNKGLVRAVGDPRERFKEDKLRMLRAIRMASRFGFALEADTLAAITAMGADITMVSGERIAQELQAMLCKPGRLSAAHLLKSSGLLAQMAPEAACVTVSSLGGMGSIVLERQDISFGLALAIWLQDAGPDVVDACGHRWRLSNHDREHAVWLVRHRHVLRDASRQPWSRIQPLLASQGAADLVLLEETRVDHDRVNVAFCRMKLGLPSVELNPAPFVNGDHLIEAGLKPGRDFVRLLALAREAQLDGVVRTPTEALAWTLSKVNGTS